MNDAMWDENRAPVGTDFGSGTYSTGYGQYGTYGVATSVTDIKEALAPLIRQIRRYDEERVRLEREGGTLSNLAEITRHLTRKVTVQGRYLKTVVPLVDQSAIRSMLLDIGSGRVHLQVRQLDSRMPVYYICRVRQDYWSEYSLIVEDLYMSPGYPMDDLRFVSLMKIGHETYHLRLSPFRPSVAEMLADGDEAPSWKVDSVLYKLGRHVFQAAWHEDQRPGVLAARHFRLPRFRNAIELLYLCLSGELCELRSAVDENMLSFFEDIYPRPAIRALLEDLTSLEGGALSDIPRTALSEYAQLLAAFRRFLRTDVAWGQRQVEVPLYKLIFGNFGRLDQVAQGLDGDEGVVEARNQLETTAERVVAAVVGA